MRVAKSLGMAAVAALALAPGPHAAAATLLGPSPYASASDSPLGVLAPGFVLEDFEDGTLVDGVSASAGAPRGPSDQTDSVDADDGVVDGSGRDGHSFFSADGAAGITFTFDPLVFGGLPGEAGLVWTDGDGAVTFEAFDADGLSLGTLGPVVLGDGADDGATAEDRFFGVVHVGGISAIRIAAAEGSIEVDHLQLGAFDHPPDCSGAFAVPTTLWPPDHRFAAIAVDGVTDPDGDPIALTVSGVGQDEPVDDVGDGATCPDALGVGTADPQIRVERSGDGDGRVYAIDFVAADGRGGRCEGRVAVCVPHDQGHGDVCGDGGAVADSSGLGCLAACDPDAPDCVPAECAGESIPRGVTKRLGRAGRLLDRAAAGRGAHGAVKRAARLLAAGERKMDRLAARERLDGDCAAALSARVQTAGRRAQQWLDAHDRR